MPQHTFTVQYTFEGDSVGNPHELALNYQAFLNTYVQNQEPWLHHSGYPVRLKSAVINAVDGDGLIHAVVVPFTQSGEQAAPAMTQEGVVVPQTPVSPIDDSKLAIHRIPGEGNPGPTSKETARNVRDGEVPGTTNADPTGGESKDFKSEKL